MSHPKPSAPPFRCEFLINSASMKTGFSENFYLASGSTVVTAAASGLSLLFKLMALLPPDAIAWAMKIYDDSPTVKSDSYDTYFKSVDMPGTYVPTINPPAKPLPYQCAMLYRSTDLTTGLHQSRFLRPLPANCVTDGKNFVPDTAWSTAWTAYVAALKSEVLIVAQGVGSLVQTLPIGDVALDYIVQEKDTAMPNFLMRARKKPKSLGQP